MVIPHQKFQNPRRILIDSSAHDLPSSLAFYANLGYHPYNLYRLISFYKLHVLDLGLVKIFYYLTNTFIQKHSSSPISKLITIFNTRYNAAPPQFNLSSHGPFQLNNNDSQVGISGKICRQTVLFNFPLFSWSLISNLDSGLLFRCIFFLHKICVFLNSPLRLTNYQISYWQSKLFSFCLLSHQLFSVYINT